MLVPAAVLVVFYEYTVYARIGTLGFPLDDSWIHAQFARNVAALRGFSYTTAEWVSGSTAPLWTLALAATLVFTSNVVVAGKVLGFLFQLAAGFGAVRLSLRLGLDVWVAAAAGAATVLLPVLVWGAVSGMEVPLATALVLGGLADTTQRPQQRPPYRGYVLLGLASLARPEALVIGVIACACELLHPLPWAHRLRRAVAGGVIVASFFAVLIVFSQITIGRPLPTTFYAKSGPGIVRAIETADSALVRRNLTVAGPAAITNYWAILLDQMGPAAWLVPVGIVACFFSRERRRAATMVALILLVTPYVMGLASPQRLKPDNVRYAAQLVGPAVVFGVGAIAWIWRARTPAYLAAAVVVATICIRAVTGAETYALAVKNIQQLHVAAAVWMRDHLPEGSTIAANDVGAIAYFSERRVLDLEGLVSPEVLPYRQFPDRGIRVVMAYRPDYIAIFPHWYPDIAARMDLFQEVHRVQISDNFISAGDTLVIYRTPWREELR